jgi:hypothetical protein
MDFGSGITVATMTGRIAVVALGAAVLIGMLAVMLFRLDHYTGRMDDHAHAAHQGM